MTALSATTAPIDSTMKLVRLYCNVNVEVEVEVKVKVVTLHSSTQQKAG